MSIFIANSKLNYYSEDADIELPLPEEAVDNEEEVNDARTGEIDPDPIVDPVEESYRIMAESETNFGRLMMAVGVEELHSYQESGVNYIHEANGAKQFFAKAKALFVSIKEKIWNVVKSFIASIQARFMNGAKFVTKYKADIQTGWTKLTDDKFKVKGYKFTNVNWDADKAIAGAKRSMTNSLDTVKVDELLDGTIELRTTDEIDDILNKVRGRFLGTDTCSTSDFGTELTKYFRDGKSDKEDLKKSDVDIDRVLSVLTSGSKKVDAVRKNYRSTEKEINKAIKKIGELERNLNKYTGEKSTHQAVAFVSQVINLEKSISTITNQAFSAQMSAMKGELAQSRRIALAAIYASGKKVEKIGESAFTSIGSVQFI